MNEITRFNFNGRELNVIDRNGEPWFLAGEVCEHLGLSNTSQACSTLDPGEVSNIILNDVSIGTPKKVIVSEAGMYALTMRSRKDEAKTFRKWVTSEVLPSIRKTGSYSLKQEPALPTNYLEALEKLVEQEKTKQLLISKNRAISNQNAILTEKIDRDQPKVQFAEAIRNSSARIQLCDFAKVFGANRNKFYLVLREDGYLTKKSKPTQRSIDQGLMVAHEEGSYIDNLGKRHLNIKTMITGKGQVFLTRKYEYLGLNSKNDDDYGLQLDMLA